MNVANFMDLSPTSHISVKNLEMFTARLEEVDQATFEDKEDDGIIPRAIHDLFKAKQHHELASEVTIHLAYLKIYNNELCNAGRGAEEKKENGMENWECEKIMAKLGLY